MSNDIQKNLVSEFHRYDQCEVKLPWPAIAAISNQVIDGLEKSGVLVSLHNTFFYILTFCLVNVWVFIEKLVDMIEDWCVIGSACDSNDENQETTLKTRTSESIKSQILFATMGKTTGKLKLVL